MRVTGTLERETAHAAVSHRVSEMRHGQGGVLFVVAEAGLGKTTILKQARGLACPDIRIAWADGDALETSLPFGLFAAVLDTVGELQDLFDCPVTKSRGDEVQARRFSGVLRWLKETAVEPMLLIIDDLHWADPDSLALLSFLARRITRLPVAIMAALRPWPAAAANVATALAYDGYATVERLAPLSMDAAEKLLVSRLSGPISDAVLRQAQQLCGGNPLLLEQLAAAVGVDGDVIGATGKGTSRVDILLTRFAGVPEVAIHYAQVASALGIRFRPQLAAEVAQLHDQEVHVALETLCQSGLVRSNAEMTAEFVYPLFQQALYDGMAVPVRARIHARAFTVLTIHGLYGEAIDHAVRADFTGDEVAITAMARTGMAALRSGSATLATRYLRAAVDAAGSRAGTDLLLALAGSLLTVGSPGEAIPICQRLVVEHRLSAAQRIQALQMLGRVFSTMRAYNDSATCFMLAAESAEAYDSEMTIEVLLDAALASLIPAGPARSLSLAERAYKLAAKTETALANRAASVWGYLAFLSGDPQGLAKSELGARTVTPEYLCTPRDLRWRQDALSTFSIAATFAERFSDAERILCLPVTTTGCAESVEATSEFAIARAIIAQRQGRLVDALGFAERASSAGKSLARYVSQAGSIRAEVLYQMGRCAESMEWCDEIDADATGRGELLTLLRVWNIRGQHLLRGSMHEAASKIYVQLEALSRQLGIGEPCCIPWARHAIAAHLSACRTSDARRVLTWLDRCAARLPCRYPQIAAVTGRASLAEAEGNYEAADTHFDAALALHDGVGLPLERVETLLRYGAFLRRRGYPSRARPLLAQAALIAESHQAGGLYEQVQEEFAAAGGRRHRNRKEPATLTSQEKRVAKLAAVGHSNKAIAARLTLSVKTIEYHLQQIYSKLGISSRRQLMSRYHNG